ncbi:MAG: hypothetical protein LC754_09260 [Acidobacteria bacterium]|nr:hypothetical protein [Acidobacteriota bacterium]
MMKLRRTAALALACAFAATSACDSEPARESAPTTPASNAAAGGAPGNAAPETSTRITSPLPDGGFKASITLPDAPTRLRAGQQEIIEVRVRNVSTSVWPALGEDDARYAITLRDRWLKPDGEKVVNDLDGGASLPHDTRPGEEVTMQLSIKAPKEHGEYVLEVDMVQERVSFFHDKGSEPARIKVSVE